MLLLMVQLFELFPISSVVRLKKQFGDAKRKISEKAFKRALLLSFRHLMGCCNYLSSDCIFLFICYLVQLVAIQPFLPECFPCALQSTVSNLVGILLALFM